MINENSDLIGLIYEASIDPALWSAALQKVAETTPCVAAMITSHDMISQTTNFQQSYGVDPVYMRTYAEKWVKTDPIQYAITMLEPGDVSGLPELLDFEAFKRHPFYLEWGRPQGYNDAINIMLERTPTRFASVSLIRNHEQGFADAATIERLRLLAPHFLRAIRIGRVLDQAALKEETFFKSLDSLAAAIFLLSPQGEFVHANASALTLIDQGVTARKIVAACQSAHKREAGMPGRTFDHLAQAGECSFKIEVGSGDVFVCHKMELAFPRARPKSALVNLTLVVVQNVTSSARATSAVASAFGLTGREREALFGLVEIGGVTSTAVMLGLSKSTVKSHLKSIFQKTQTHRQSDLVRLVVEWATPFRRSM